MDQIFYSHPMFDNPIILIIVIAAALLRWLWEKVAGEESAPKRPTAPGQPNSVAVVNPNRRGTHSPFPRGARQPTSQLRRPQRNAESARTPQQQQYKAGSAD